MDKITKPSQALLYGRAMYPIRCSGTLKRGNAYCDIGAMVEAAGSSQYTAYRWISDRFFNGGPEPKLKLPDWAHRCCWEDTLTNVITDMNDSGLFSTGETAKYLASKGY